MELKAEAQSAKVGMTAADVYPAFSLGGVLGTLVSTTNGIDTRPMKSS